MATKGWEQTTPHELKGREVQPTRRRSVTAPSPTQPEAATKRSKYGVRQDAAGKAERTADGILFDSRHEMKRYLELTLLVKAGEIASIELQPSYALTVTSLVTGEIIHIGRFSPDFRFTRAGVTVIEDAKSPATRKNTAYRLRKRICEALYGIEIVEV